MLMYKLIFLLFLKKEKAVLAQLSKAGRMVTNKITPIALLVNWHYDTSGGPGFES